MNKEDKAAKQRERYHDPTYNQDESDRRSNPRVRFSKARFDAKRRKTGPKEFTITFEEYALLISKRCTYCNGDISKETGSGLDRIDNSKGYLPDNVNPCCRDCNTRRSNSMSAAEFKRQSKLNGYWKE